jgi:hypothetical protein
MMISADSAKAVVILGVAAVVALALYKLYGFGKDAIDKIGNLGNKTAAAAAELGKAALGAVDPTSADNVVSRSTNWATGGDSTDSIGTRLANWFQPDPNAIYNEYDALKRQPYSQANAERLAELQSKYGLAAPEPKTWSTGP